MFDDASGLFQSASDSPCESSSAAEISPEQHQRYLLNALLESLKEESQAIRDGGQVAPSGVYVDEYSSRGCQRVRLRATKGNIPGTYQKSRGLGKFNGSQHRDWSQRCKRRNRLQEIERRVLIIQGWIQDNK